MYWGSQKLSPIWLFANRSQNSEYSHTHNYDFYSQMIGKLAKGKGTWGKLGTSFQEFSSSGATECALDSSSTEL